MASVVVHTILVSFALSNPLGYLNTAIGEKVVVKRLKKMWVWR